MEKSLKQIIYETNVLVDAHVQLRSFHYGDLLDIIKKGTIDYASCFLSINNSSNNAFFETVSLELFVFDILAQDDSNRTDIENTTKRILNDLITTIRYSNRWNNFSEVLTDIGELKYYDNLQDKLAGWGGTIQLKVYQSDCLVGLPIDGYDFDMAGDFEATVDAIVRNSIGDTLATKLVSDDDNIVTVPNISFTDSDGTITSEPSGVDLVCTPPTTVVVDFSADKVEVEVGEDVTFTDTSTESPTEWAWDFGDTTTSDLQNPVKNWATAGTFDIRLLAAKIGLGGFAEKLAYIDVIIKNPLQIFGSELYDWWDYTDLTTQSITGGLIDSATSKGTNAGVMAASGTSRPASIVGVNSLPVADFDGVNDFMEVAASTAMYNLLHDNSDSFVIIIARINDANPNDSMRILNNCTSVSSEVGFLIAYDDRDGVGRNDRIVAQAGNGVSPAINNISDDDFFPSQQYNILYAKNDPQNATASQRNILTSNNSLTSSNNVLTDAVSTANASSNLTIGTTPSNSFYLKGQFTEIYILNSFPTPTQITQLNAYLNNKYGGTFPIV